MNVHARLRGFTIVELLIVIVVIGILAAITIVAYNGIQARARDNIRINDLSEIAKSLQLYAIDKGPMTNGSGCGSGGNGGGWFSYESPANSYPKSVANCLKDTGYIQKDILDPSGSVTCTGLSCRAYILSGCTQGGALSMYIYANLETVGHASIDTDATCDPNKDINVGSNYFVKVTY